MMTNTFVVEKYLRDFSIPTYDIVINFCKGPDLTPNTHKMTTNLKTKSNKTKICWNKICKMHGFYVYFGFLKTFC